MRLGIGDKVFESAYTVGKYVPYPFKQHALTVLNIPISMLSIFNANMIKKQYEEKTIYFKYTDAISLLYFLFSLKGKTVQETPFKTFDLPDYFDTGIDIGAHFGSVAILLGALNDIELFCFEPNEYNIGILEKNLECNSISANIIKKVVSNENDTMVFYEGNRIASNDHTTKPSSNDKFRNKIQRESISLTEYIDFGDRTVFIKIDAEGEEKKILEDVCGSDVGNISGIVDIHQGRLEDGVTDIINIFEENDFTYKKVEHAKVPVYYFTNFENISDIEV